MQLNVSSDVSGCMRTRLLLLSLAVLLSTHAFAQTKSGSEDKDLFHTIEALDAKLFDAFNRCDLETFGSFFPEKLEFYHDNGGLTNETRESVVADVKKYICGTTRRDLVPGTLEVYPMHGYGALEIGVHRFHHPGHDDTEAVGEAKFIHLWKYEKGEWKLTRVISYEHHAQAKK
jgi:hypothetical protein